MAANTGYNNQVAGIGRDDKSDFDQRQAQSEAAGSLIEIYHGSFNSSFPTSNEANNNAFSVNKSFLILGNNAASVAALDKAIQGGNQQAVSRFGRCRKRVLSVL